MKEITFVWKAGDEAKLKKEIHQIASDIIVKFLGVWYIDTTYWVIDVESENTEAMVLVALTYSDHTAYKIARENQYASSMVEVLTMLKET